MVTIPAIIVAIFLVVFWDAFFINKYFCKNKSSYRLTNGIAGLVVLICVAAGVLIGSMINSRLLEHSINTGNVEVVTTSHWLVEFPQKDNSLVYLIRHKRDGFSSPRIAFTINGKTMNCSSADSSKVCSETKIVIKEEGRDGFYASYEEQVIIAKGWVRWFAKKRIIRVFKVPTGSIREGKRQETVKYIVLS